jgi:hypothetical protein
MSRIHLPKLEFYITNVCNLTCDHCNRFNNYNFRGYQRWSDYAEIYQKWGNYLDIGQVVVLGGEPLLNSTITEWVRGLHAIWPGWKQILTNGHHLLKVKDLYPACHQNKFWIGVSLHNTNDVDQLFADIKQFLVHPIKTYHGKDNNAYGSDYCFIDSNDFRVAVWTQNDFMTSAIRVNEAGKYTLHNSNPEKAHKACPMAKYKSYHFINGKLYKCGPVALFPEFDQQFGLDLSQGDRDLMMSYRPLSVDEFETRGEQFFAELDNPIDQCKFCCDNPVYEKIWPIRKGSKQ